MLPYIDAANNRLRKLFVNDHLIGDKYFDMVARTITKCYQDALKDIRNDISKVYEKFGDSVTYSELHQYNRLAKLEQQIEAKLKEVGVTVNKQIRQSIKETFASTYYNTGYATETMTGMKLGFGELDSKVVDAAIYNPYDKIKWNIRVVQNIAHANQKIRESLTTGLIQGHGYAKIAKSVNEYLGKNAYEMLRIMRTEGHRAQQAARIVAIDKVNSASKRTGMKVKKVWLATLDMRTREDHREMDGKEADEDGIFHLPDGSKTEAPGHSGVAAQDIHCRCDVIIQIADLPYGTRYDQLGKELTKNKTWKEWAQERGIKFKPYGGVVGRY